MNVQEIWDNKLSEGQQLEYKEYSFNNGKFQDLSDNHKTKLMKIISSFANTEGGTIVLGVGEDENHNPNKLNDVGISKDGFEMWEQSFRQLLSSKIKPVVHGVKCTHDTIEDKSVIKIDVPMSLNKPHAVNNGSKDELFIRYGNLTIPMSYQDMKNAFENKSYIENKINDFKNERISMLLGGEIIGDLEGQSAMVIHIIPELSMRGNNYVNIRDVANNKKIKLFSPVGMDGHYTYNMDGIMNAHHSYEEKLNAYTQLFHSGSIEVVETRMMNYKPQYANESGIYDWKEFEKLLFDNLISYIKTIETLDVPKPFHIFVTLLNIKNKRSIGDFELHPVKPFSRSVIDSLPAYIMEDIDDADALYPLMSSLANAFGFKSSGIYTEEGMLIDKNY
ncbi:ATP-binding protein [Macrococcoides canis]|uniref:AlbA family DNA-binding domain-containing protein n=1 Tax=Macrococcoides canis TaxID=1855823 RepID=UPI0010603451|nr:ATP-binding protein [Macrococcus canis]TDM40932.1 ATP-binding protein [Macrococcus canis]